MSKTARPTDLPPHNTELSSHPLGRRSWNRLITESGLPTEVRELIHTVVRQSRLTRAEKADVAEELISHFADGAARGHSFEKLIEDFGEPKDAAQLIRSSKIRNRPMSARMIQISGFLGCGAVVTYLVALVLFYSGTPNPSIDYLGEFNQPVDRIPEQQRAWHVYRDVWAKFGFCEGQAGRFEEIYHVDPDDPSETRLVRPGDPEWEQAISKLQNSTELIDSFHQGARLPHLGVKFFANKMQYSRSDRAALYPDEDPDTPSRDDLWEVDGMDAGTQELLEKSMIGVLLPHIQSFRKASRILIVDSRWALQQGDTDRVVKNIETILGFSRQVAEPEILICALVGMSVSRIGYDLIDEVLADNPDRFNDQQLKRIQQAIESADPARMVGFTGERLSIKDIIQRVYTDDGNGDGRLTPQGLALLRNFDLLYGFVGEEQPKSFLDSVMETKAIGGPVSLWYCASRKELTEKLDELFDEIEGRFDSPYWEGEDFGDIEETLEKNARQYLVLAQVFPVVTQIYRAKERTLANQEGMLLAIASHRYRLKHGEWPPTVSTAVRSFLRNSPRDRFTGQPLKIAQDGDEFRVYSVGGDGDDDGGRSIRMGADGSFAPPGVDQQESNQHHNSVPVPASQLNFALSPHLDGDWVLWPRLADQ